MDPDNTVTFMGDHVRADVKGKKSLAISRALYIEIVATCEANNCFLVLGVSDATASMSFTEGFSHADLFRELGVTNKYRIAWAEPNDKVRETTSFIETVLSNRGLPGRVFPTEAEARRWLFS